MAQKLEQTQNMTQTQTLAPLQVQYVQMLSLNTPAIEDEVQRRLDENPALEAVDDVVEDNTYGETAEQLQSADYADQDEAVPFTVSRTGTTSRGEFFESGDYSGTTADSLLRQLGENSDLDARTRALAEYIVGSLDSNGRMTRTLAALAQDIGEATGLEVSRNDLVPAFNAVRALDPAGVGAVDLRDCLLLQLQRIQPSPRRDLALDIVQNNFDLFVDRRFEKIRGRTDRQLFDSAVDLIRSLNPKPGGSDSAEFGTEDARMHIVPDFTVEPDPADATGRRFIIALTQHIPELAVSKSYDPEAIDGTRNAEARAFARSRAREASDFIETLRRRSDTLMKVMTAIVSLQTPFFHSEDPADIRPMILRDVAAVTGRDQSVISRATMGKYVATPGGVYPLKMFFNERPNDDNDVSTHSILNIIRTIVDAEDKAHPLSDDALTEALHGRGIDIARRTVAKYREQLRIPNSRARRLPR